MIEETDVPFCPPRGLNKRVTYDSVQVAVSVPEVGDEAVVKFKKPSGDQSPSGQPDGSCQWLTSTRSLILVVVSLMIVGAITMILLNLASSSSVIHEQVHLSLGINPSEMVVTWVTLTEPDNTVGVEYELSNRTVINLGTTKKFMAGSKRPIWIHRAKLTNLAPLQSHRYRVGDGTYFSQWFTLRTTSNDPQYHPRFAFFGDMQVDGASIAPLTKEASRGFFDAVIHVGDIAYDLHDKHGVVGDQFFRNIQPIASRIPYQVTAGNHEKWFNFTHYDNRFSMIDQRTKSRNNFFWSSDVGSVHLIGLNVEFYFFAHEFGQDQIQTQYNWLVRDLQEANKPENRKIRPWIIVFSHKPFYCGEKTVHCYFDCNKLTEFPPFDMEKMLKEHSVDLYISGHDHLYRRLWPIYKGQFVDDSENSDPYYHPAHPVHIITGLGGCDLLSLCGQQKIAGNAVTIEKEYGYSIVNVINSTHLNLRQVSAATNQTLDEVTIVRQSTL